MSLNRCCWLVCIEEPTRSNNCWDWYRLLLLVLESSYYFPLVNWGIHVFFSGVHLYRRKKGLNVKKCWFCTYLFFFLKSTAKLSLSRFTSFLSSPTPNADILSLFSPIFFAWSLFSYFFAPSEKISKVKKQTGQ